jgi:Helix-turn-helix domain
MNLELSQPEWMDLKALRGYACVSERTLREWIRRPIDPLPAAQVGAKILVKRSQFDHWLENHRVRSLDMDCIVDKLLAEVTEKV